ncbi:hypothetical protein ACHAWO_007427 [Cyclotella atomus]|uniref:LAGLIDADG homing endonuclease n=1 Tax=Cyclotella atomus TaxID=382360 RepID=A0ABD3NSI4_9STRA
MKFLLISNNMKLGQMRNGVLEIVVTNPAGSSPFYTIGKKKCTLRPTTARHALLPLPSISLLYSLNSPKH